MKKVQSGGTRLSSKKSFERCFSAVAAICVCVWLLLVERDCLEQYEVHMFLPWYHALYQMIDWLIDSLVNRLSNWLTGLCFEHMFRIKQALKTMVAIFFNLIKQALRIMDV